ncbi:MAG: M13 family peptidase [Malacoplasma sp.]|nr:M13 family peptidase [Malacoplasma sp.]
MEKKFRIQDDLYEFVNHDELAKKEIPNDLPSVGGFRDLSIKVEKTLMNDFEKLSKDPFSIECKFVKFAVGIYNIIIRNRKKPEEVSHILSSYVEKIEKYNTLEKFNQNFFYFYENLFPLPFRFGVDVDMKATEKHALVILGPKTILPDTTYYEENNPSKENLLKIWKEMAKTILPYFFNDQAKIDKLIEQTLFFDEMIARRVKSQLEWADYTKNYNPFDFKEAESFLKPVDFKNIVEKIYQKVPNKIIAFDKRFLKEFNLLFNEQNYSSYLSWSIVNFILDGSEHLCDDLRIKSGIFSRFLVGTKEAYKIKKYAFKFAAGSLFSEAVGIYYGKKYFGEKAKADVINMVHGLVQSYKERLSENQWLSQETKEKAILKLNKMKIKIGYPDNLSEVYKWIKFNPKDNLYEIIKSIGISKRNYENSLLYKPVDTSLWMMPGHLVNACYNPTVNDITFPAAILQAPFYSLNQSKSENFGGIGTVIGHEISHAFDNNGAQCDENGNLNNWWKENDYTKFKEKTTEMIEQFDGLPLGDGKVNGELVVSENIADLGGMAASLQTLEREQTNPDYENFFKNYARVWAQKSRKEYEALLLTIDVHAPTYWRANMQPRNFKQWYDTFNVVSTDKMYLPENKRVVIW